MVGGHQAFAKPWVARTLRFSGYTSLNAGRSIISKEALNTDLLCTTRKVLTPHNADTSKHCRFCQNFSHSAKKCISFKDKIHELIHVGHL